MGFSVTVRKNNIGQLQADIKDRTIDNVRDTANLTRENAKAKAPVRTGALKASFYINGPNNESDYGWAVLAAKERNPAANILPERHAADVDTSVGQLRDALGRFSLPEAVVAPAVEYDIFVEEGTVFMAPRPILRPAALEAQNFFISKMSQLADGY